MEKETPHFQGRLALQQRVLPAYRGAFFNALAVACEGGLSVFAGQPRPEESISTATHLDQAQYVTAHNLHIGRVTSPFYLCWQKGLMRWLGTWNPDALIMEANPRYISSRFGAAWMRAQGRPVLGWGLGLSRNGGLERIRSRGRQRFLKQFDGMIAYSQRGAQEYREVGFPPERLFVAPNAVVPRPTNQPPVRADSFNERPSVLFVGRLQSRKRIDLLLNACAALPVAMQPRLVIIGDGPAREEFQSLAAQVYPHAEFPGAKHGAELEPYYAQADLFVLPGTGGLALHSALLAVVGGSLSLESTKTDSTQVVITLPEDITRK